MKRNLKDNYDDVPDHLICMALESVNFDEKRAREILKIMKQEDSEAQTKKNLRRLTTYCFVVYVILIQKKIAETPLPILPVRPPNQNAKYQPLKADNP